MPLTQDDQRKYDLIALLSSFGEPITFTPHQGEARSMTAIVKRDEGLRKTGTGTETSEVVSVTVLRDSSHELGGIDAIDVRDVVTLGNETEGRRFVFTGNIVTKSMHGWKLEFKCGRVKQHGRQNVS